MSKIENLGDGRKLMDAFYVVYRKNGILDVKNGHITDAARQKARKRRKR